MGDTSHQGGDTVDGQLILTRESAHIGGGCTVQREPGAWAFRSLDGVVLEVWKIKFK